MICYVTRNIRENTGLPGDFLINWTISVLLHTSCAASKTDIFTWVATNETLLGQQMAFRTLQITYTPHRAFPCEHAASLFSVLFFPFCSIPSEPETIASQVAYHWVLVFLHLLNYYTLFCLIMEAQIQSMVQIISLISLDMDKTLHLHVMFGVLSPVPPSPWVLPLLHSSIRRHENNFSFKLLFGNCMGKT